MASLDAKTGEPDPKFGKNGVVDLMDGPRAFRSCRSPWTILVRSSSATRRRRARRSRARRGTPQTKTGADGTVGIDPALGQIAASSPADHRRRRHHRRQLAHSRLLPDSRCATCRATSAASTSAPASSSGSSTSSRSPASSARTRGRTASKIGTPGVGKNDAWAPYSADPDLGLVYIPVGMPLMRRVRRPSSRRQPVRQQPRRARREDRQAEVALPDGASRHLGLRHADGAEPARHHGRRQASARSSRRRRKQGWVYTFDRATGEPIWPIVGDAGAAERRAGRAGVADAADSVEAGAVLAAGPRRSRSHRLHAGDQGRGAASWRKQCRMGPYYIPAVAGDGSAPSGLTARGTRRARAAA